MLLRVLGVVLVVVSVAVLTLGAKRREDKTKCPQVRDIKNFNLHEFLGQWFVVQYYASSEEALSYSCMRADFTESSAGMEVCMNFTYSFSDDPAAERLLGNITWHIPEASRPAHWVHAEDTYEGIYNTFVLDSDYKSWALLLHCAEKSKSPRYLSSFIMSRDSTLGPNVVSYLRDKLPRYDIDLAFMFPMNQTHCEGEAVPLPGLEPAAFNNLLRQSAGARRHPMKNVH